MKNEKLEGIYEGLKLAIKIIDNQDDINKAKKIIRSHMDMLSGLQSIVE